MKKNNFKILLLIICFVILAIIFINFFSNFIKNKISQNSKGESIDYIVEDLNKNFVKIILPIDQHKKNEGSYNKFVKGNIDKLGFLVKTKKCLSKNLFILIRYNNEVYSNIIKLNTLNTELFLNLYKSKANLNFKHLEIHKKDLNCLGKIFYLKKYELPFSYYINFNKKNIITKSTNKFNNLDFTNLKVLKKDANLIIKENKIFFHDNFGDQVIQMKNNSLFYNYYYTNIRKPFFIKDVLLGEITSPRKGKIFFKCRLLNGGAMILLFDPSNYQILDFKNCRDNSEIFIDVPEGRLLNLLISSKIFPFNTHEANFKLIIN